MSPLFVVHLILNHNGNETPSPVVLFTKILTIDFDLRRKRTILFLFTKILTRILACKIGRISTIVVTLS